MANNKTNVALLIVKYIILDWIVFIGSEQED